MGRCRSSVDQTLPVPGVDLALSPGPGFSAAWVSVIVIMALASAAAMMCCASPWSLRVLFSMLWPGVGTSAVQPGMGTLVITTGMGILA